MPTRTRRDARVPLSRERILQAALELADEGGVESLTMRKLGQTLGFEAMSLYNHVANKDDVIDGILDLVLAETEPPSAEGGWAAAVRASAISVQHALRDHSWACSLVMSPRHIRPARLSYMDALLSRLREAGFSPFGTYHAYHVLDAHILGFSLWQSTHSGSFTKEDAAMFAEKLEEWIPRARYPYLHEHGDQHLAEGPHQDVSAFELGLDLILEGLEKLRAAGY
jgi:AcrR family transcriptional regulator